MPRNMINEIGNRYGKLAVIECAGKHKCRAYLWHCKCDCGNKTIVLGSLLRGGQVRSCGCSRVIEEKPGAKYGKLTVIGRSKEKGSQSGAYWRCKCDCGKEINVCGGNLRNGAISCGCSRFLPKGQAAFNGVFCKLRNAAKNVVMK